MTPFGERVRGLRRARGLSQREMAEDLHISAAYLSALEHGRKGRPSAGLVHQICEYFGLIWDEAEEMKRLAELSHPRVVVDTARLSAAATELANLLAARIARLPEETICRLIAEIDPDRGRTG
ncbi:MAG: helix-turn-helix domain-containing protein [Proteobacteria bacterium]|nr:helix-turn-helix domain-containing protein [Pseudomonadota bacterium]